MPSTAAPDALPPNVPSSPLTDPLTDPAAPTLTASALGVQRGDRPLFRRLELTLEPGQLVWLRGRNGRGKTSLLRVLAGLSSPSAGEVLCDGQPLRKLAPAGRQRLLYIAHTNALKDDLTVAESLRFLGALHGHAPSTAEIDTALALLGIARCGHAAVRTLSQGQRRRAALARLALPQPASIWLLDEPFDSLDDEGILALHGLLTAQARRGGSVVMTSHQAVTLADPAPTVLDLDRFAVAT